MKKIALFLIAGFIGLQTASFAAERGTDEYKRLVEVKKAQRLKKDEVKKDPSKLEKSFWQKEAERSGFAGTAAMFGNAVGGVLPVKKSDSDTNLK